MLPRLVASAVPFILAAALAAHCGARDSRSLVDQRGRPFAFSALAGAPTAITFVAAHCTETCPLINAQFAQAQALLQQRHIRGRLLTITLDPEHDSAADMRAIARTFHADPARWLLVAGPAPTIHRIMQAFGVFAERGRRGYADMHTTFVYFMDERGVYRKSELASTNASERIAGILGALQSTVARADHRHR